MKCNICDSKITHCDECGKEFKKGNKIIERKDKENRFRKKRIVGRAKSL